MMMQQLDASDKPQYPLTLATTKLDPVYSTKTSMEGPHPPLKNPPFIAIPVQVEIFFERSA